ncbi:hypothetical protein GGI06_002858 [Coemansia sp. S85]|nr:hypothetical protein GGI06_002858 [Coemansia sp. S85]
MRDLNGVVNRGMELAIALYRDPVDRVGDGVVSKDDFLECIACSSAHMDFSVARVSSRTAMRPSPSRSSNGGKIKWISDRVVWMLASRVTYSISGWTHARAAWHAMTWDELRIGGSAVIIPSSALG